MKINEIICEATVGDDQARRWGWDGVDPEMREFLGGKLKNVGATTQWTCAAAIADILGKDRVTTDEDEMQPGMILLDNGNSEFAQFDHVPEDDMGIIILPDYNSRAAKNLASAVHEAYHAYMWIKAKGGQLYANEKFVNQLATRWLQAHLSGPELHVALERILRSKISYGHN